jgi:glyoxylase-like metal-dependent hydrolase (beta-lactamase superfamily II)
MSQLNGLRGDLEIVQLLCGEEIAGTAAAAQSANFVYMVMDSETRRAAVFDACWDIASIFGAAEALEVEITAALYTHHHYDHAGGRMGRRGVLQGAKEMVNRGVRVLVHEDDTTAVRKQCDVPQAEPMADGEALSLGGTIEIRCLHTPGHTPGSACFALGCSADSTIDALITGDTLFVGAFGRVDLPTSDPG